MRMKLTENLQSQIEKGISILKKGGLVAYPTDTVYGLGASAMIPRAVERIYDVKKRPGNMALPLLLADVSRINTVARSVPPLAWFLAGRFLPGALTLVLDKADSVSGAITAGSNKVAVRVPAHPVPVALIRGLGAPIIGTSANISGQSSAVTAGEVSSRIGAQIDLVIDGGPTPGGVASTVIDLTGDNPIILREGAVSRSKLEHACVSFDRSIVVL
ncbi:MAG: L-threonylcarbamoyladenylate synthase [Chloroflexota bacterium]